MTTDQDSPSSQYWTSGQFFFFWGHVSRYCFSLMFTEGVGRILLWAGIVKRCMQVFAHDVIWYVGLRWVWPCCTGIVCSHLERMWCTTCKPVSSPVNINRHHTFINKSRKMCTPLYPLSFNPLLFDITQRKRKRKELYKNVNTKPSVECFILHSQCNSHKKLRTANVIAFQVGVSMLKHEDWSLFVDDPCLILSKMYYIGVLFLRHDLMQFSL